MMLILKARALGLALAVALFLAAPLALAAQAPPPGESEDPPQEAPAGETEPRDDDIVIEAESEKNDAYIRRTAPGVIKSDAPLMETPQSVQIVPKQVYEDQKAASLQEAARNVSNVGTGTGLSTGDTLTIRGFPTTLFLIDGLPNTTGLLGYAPRELSQFSRLEILKGPSSVLFGSIEPGGAINMITKKPLGEEYYEVELSHGRWDNNAATVDLTGPVNEDRTLLYRLISTYRSSDSFRDEIESERGFVAPALTWLVTPDTSISVFGHYQKDTVRVDRGIPPTRDARVAALRDTYEQNAPGIVQQAYPASELFPEEFVLDDRVNSERYFGNKEGDRNEQTIGSAGYLWETDFDNWTFRNRTRGESSATLDQRTTVTGLNPDNRTVTRRYDKRDWYMSSYTTQFTVDGKFKTGNVTHRPYAGVDFTHAFLKVSILDQYSDAGTKDLYLSDAEKEFFDKIGSPDLNFLVLQEFDKAIDPASFFPIPTQVSAWMNDIGIFGRHQVSIADKLHVMVGARYDRVRGFGKDNSYSLRRNLFFVPSITPTLFTNPQKTDIRADHISPQGGVVYRPIKQMSIFASASQSFNQDFRVLLISGLTPKPIISNGYEGGLKFELFDESLVATLTGFEIRKTNTVVNDPLNINQLLQSGEQTHTGFEADVLATPVKGWNLIASYGYVDAKITKDDSRDPTTGKKLIEGHRPALVPEHNASAWVVYELQSGWLKGVGMGMGAYYNSERYATVDNDLVLPGYTIANGLVYYRMDNAKLSVTVKNLYNQRYIESATTKYQLAPGRPFEAIVSLKMNF